MSGGFVDTNVFVYAFTTDRRAAAAQNILEQGGATDMGFSMR